MVQQLKNEPTFIELVADVATGARELASAHAQQMRGEINEQLSRARTAGIIVINGTGICLIGLAFVAVALVRVLVDVAAWPDWAAWLLVGGIALGAGAIALAVGTATWQNVRAVPDRTLRSIRESMSWIKN